MVGRILGSSVFTRTASLSVGLAGATVAVLALSRQSHPIYVWSQGLGAFLALVLVATFVMCFSLALRYAGPYLFPRELSRQPRRVQAAALAGLILFLLPTVLGGGAFITAAQGPLIATAPLLASGLIAGLGVGGYARWLHERWPAFDQ